MHVSQHQPTAGGTTPEDAGLAAPAGPAAADALAAPADPAPSDAPAAPSDAVPEDAFAGLGSTLPLATGDAAAAGTAAARSLYVPVRRGPAGTVLRLWRTPFGTRTAVAFTSDRRLRSVLGPCQPWIRLSEPALRRMAEPLGTRHVTVDPVLTARPPASWSGGDSAALCVHPGRTSPAAAP
jgi:hypothetical protein